MLPPLLRLLVLSPAMLVGLSAQAHEPKEDTREDPGPDCAEMREMGHSKLDMNDPIVRAMMQKCMSAKQEDEQRSHGTREHQSYGDHGKPEVAPGEEIPGGHEHET